ncbi:MAG: phosphotransferase [Methylococcales bacterium]|nr:phosphotransferase [Methylococcales bacterium]
MMTLDKRATALLCWLKNDLSLTVNTFEPASSDASFRRYFRVTHPQGTYVVMDAPPDKENTEPFIRIARLLKDANVNVPHIHHSNLPQGFLLLDDFGAVCLLDQLNASNAQKLYLNAFDELFKLQTNLSPKASKLPVYDASLLTQELSLFYNWFSQQLIGETIPETIKQNLNSLLSESALAQPQVCVHRDYHSRNLMLIDTDTIGVIDFQDAVIGAITYDLVSLLRDCYITWSEGSVESWLNRYYQRLLAHNMVDVSFKDFKRWFDLMGLQRHMKAIGIFARLHLRDQKSGYLADIPRTMAYIETVCQQYSELEGFYHWLSNQILPIYRQKL